MASNFDAFCQQLSAMLRIEPPALTPDEQGVRAFTLTHRSTDIYFIERKHNGVDRMSMLVRFGAPSADRVDEALANLMRANYLMLNDGNAFVQHPDSHEVFLHTLVWLDRVNVENIHAQLDKFADSVARWKSDAFLRRENAAPLDGASLAMRA